MTLPTRKVPEKGKHRGQLEGKVMGMIHLTGFTMRGERADVEVMRALMSLRVKQRKSVAGPERLRPGNQLTPDWSPAPIELNPEHHWA